MSMGGLIRLAVVFVISIHSSFSSGGPRDSSTLSIDQSVTVNSVEYQVTSYIGKGKFGKVYGVTNGGSNFALKHINKRSFQDAHSLNLSFEPQLHASLRHPNVVGLISWEETEDDVFMILEKCGADLATTIISNQKPFKEIVAKQYMYELMKGIAYLHSLSIYHGDVKADHLLLNIENRTSVKIIDFGSAGYTSTVNDNYAGTHLYAAPEVWTFVGPLLASDIWSAGVVLYAMLTRKFPFSLSKELSLSAALNEMNKRVVWSYFTRYSQLPRDLLEKMLVVDPTRRLTADQVLSHPWFDELRGL